MEGRRGQEGDREGGSGEKKGGGGGGTKGTSLSTPTVNSSPHSRLS